MALIQPTPRLTPKDFALYKRFQADILHFILKMWGLRPQPLKPEYQHQIEYCELNEVTVDWFEPFVKGKHLTWQQYLLILAVQRGLEGRASRKIAVESGVGTGKSSGIAILILWFLFTHKDAQVPCTAPTTTQMYNALWKELASWLYRMPARIQALYEWSSEYLRIKERANTWYARARTAAKDRPEALAGVHSDYVMAVIDEASGVIDEVFEKGEGVLAGEFVFVVMISQHTRLVGYFHDAFGKDAANWQRLRFNSEESPIVDKQFVQRIIDKDGLDSDRYRVEVKGEPPKADAVDDKGYVPLFLEEDLRYVPKMPFVGRKWLGIDPAGRGNDKACWVVRDNFHAEVLLEEKKSDDASLVKNTIGIMQMLQIKPEDVFIDDFGIGAKLVANLARQSIVIGQTTYPIYVNGINTGDMCEEEEEKSRFSNLRAKLAWDTKQWLKTGGNLSKHDSWVELLNIRYRASLRNRLEIMPKEIMRKLGIKSPNAYDALALTMLGKNTSTQIKVIEDGDYDPHSVV